MFLLEALHRDIPLRKDWVEAVQALESDYEAVLTREVEAQGARKQSR